MPDEYTSEQSPHSQASPPAPAAAPPERQRLATPSGRAHPKNQSSAINSPKPDSEPLVAETQRDLAISQRDKLLGALSKEMYQAWRYGAGAAEWYLGTARRFQLEDYIPMRKAELGLTELLPDSPRKSGSAQGGNSSRGE